MLPIVMKISLENLIVIITMHSRKDEQRETYHKGLRSHEPLLASSNRSIKWK